MDIAKSEIWFLNGQFFTGIILVFNNLASLKTITVSAIAIVQKNRWKRLNIENVVRVPQYCKNSRKNYQAMIFLNSKIFQSSFHLLQQSFSVRPSKVQMHLALTLHFVVGRHKCKCPLRMLWVQMYFPDFSVVETSKKF